MEGIDLLLCPTQRDVLKLRLFGDYGTKPGIHEIARRLVLPLDIVKIAECEGLLVLRAALNR